LAFDVFNKFTVVHKGQGDNVLMCFYQSLSILMLWLSFYASYVFVLFSLSKLFYLTGKQT